MKPKLMLLVLGYKLPAASILAGEKALAAGSESGASAGSSFSAIAGSFRPTADLDMGEFSSPKMTVDVVQAPHNESERFDLLPEGSSYVSS